MTRFHIALPLLLLATACQTQDIEEIRDVRQDIQKIRRTREKRS